MSDRLILSTDGERRSVEIDGVAYPLPDPDDLPLDQVFEMGRLSGRLPELVKAVGEDNPSETAKTELDSALRRMVAIILAEAAPEVRARLSQPKLLRIVSHYRAVKVTAEADAAPFGPGAKSGPAGGG